MGKAAFFKVRLGFTFEGNTLNFCNNLIKKKKQPLLDQ